MLIINESIVKDKEYIGYKYQRRCLDCNVLFTCDFGGQFRCDKHKKINTWYHKQKELVK